jgi:translocation and assembly module TamB
LAALPEGQSVEFNRLYAQYGDLPLELVDPLLIKRTESELVFNKSIFRLGMGRLEGSGRFEKRAVALDLTFEGFPLTALAVTGMPDITGAATGRVSFLGPWARPEGSLELRIDRLGVQYPQLNELPPKTLRARAELKQGRLQTEITVQGLKTKQFDAQLGIPVVFSLSPFACSLPPQGELDGSLSGSMDLAWITLLIGPDDQKVEGQLGGTLFLKGTLADPNITGGMQVEKGVYENVPSGTVLRNIGLEVKANGRRLILDRASASDGEKGTVSANGWLDIIPGQGYPLGVELDLEQVMLLRQDHATASVQGKLKFSGSLAQPVLTGELQVGPAGLHIPEELSPEISGLDVVEVNRVGQETPPPQPVQTAGGHVLKLDVLLRGTDRVLLSGRGIESEWKGDLRVGGWADEPVITGNLSAVRGRLKFLGKRFVLSRGLINFDGATPPSPYMDMLAEARAADIIARVHISGPMLDPKVELSSEPSLPSDEIFSRILFGRSVSEIKPLQAVQLAQATNMMAGGGGLDFIGQMQSFLGIDQLEVKQKEEEDIAKSTVSAGKYLSDTVYIEVERGIEAETGKATVEVELTPNISIETEVGVNATGGAGLNWKWDY